MKKNKIKLIFCLFPFLMLVSCKKDNNQEPLKNEKQNASLSEKRLSTVGTDTVTISNPQRLAVTSSTTTLDGSKVLKTAYVTVLPTPLKKSNSGYSTNLVDGGGGFHPFIATVMLAGGVGTVTLNEYWQYSGDLTLKATVWGVRASGDAVYWYVTYVYSRNGAAVSSSVENYSVYF